MADPKTILCVDDDEDDRFFLSNAIQHINPALKVVKVENHFGSIEADSGPNKGTIVTILLPVDLGKE